MAQANLELSQFVCYLRLYLLGNKMATSLCRLQPNFSLHPGHAGCPPPPVVLLLVLLQVLLSLAKHH
jgi:hypothetical protein